MQPGMFPFAGLFPMQPGHMRRIYECTAADILTAEKDQFFLPQIVKSCPASMYLLMYEAELSAFYGLLTAGIFSTADGGATLRSLAVSQSADTSLTLLSAAALITPSGAGIGVSGLAASSGSTWAAGSARAGGPDTSGQITGFTVGAYVTPGGGSYVTALKKKLSIWALE